MTLRRRVSLGHLRAWAVAVVVATIGFTLGYMLLGWSPSDALYMTIISLTTVGFREVRELDETGRVLTMGATIAGVALVFGGVGIMAETLLADLGSGRRERKRMQDAIDRLHDHYVVCGYGRVGSTVARLLAEAGRLVVVMDINEVSVERARGEGHLVVAGDATDDATLRAAGIERARGLVASIDSDANNVYVVLSARSMAPGLFIVGRASGPAAEAKLSQAGADRIVSPYAMAGRRIAELATRPAVVDFIDAALSPSHLTFSIEQRLVEAGGPLEGRTIGELASVGVFTLALVRGRGEYDAHPPADRRLAAGEEVILSATTETLHGLVGDR